MYFRNDWKCHPSSAAFESTYGELSSWKKYLCDPIENSIDYYWTCNSSMNFKGMFLYLKMIFGAEMWILNCSNDFESQNEFQKAWSLVIVLKNCSEFRTNFQNFWNYFEIFPNVWKMVFVFFKIFKIYVMVSLKLLYKFPWQLKFFENFYDIHVFKTSLKLF